MSWCPKCGYEYKEGYTVCSDCNVELVESLETQKTAEPEEIYEEDVKQIFEADENEDTQDEKDSVERKYINEKTGVYVAANTRASEYKLGAITLLIVGIIGITVIILMDLGVIPFLPAVSKVLLNIVMGGLFLIFVVMGISSVGSYKKMLELAQKEEKLESDILEYFKENVNDETLEISDVSNLTKEELCLRQYEQISGIVTEVFGDIDAAFLEYITEKIYVNMFD